MSFHRTAALASDAPGLLSSPTRAPHKIAAHNPSQHTDLSAAGIAERNDRKGPPNCNTQRHSGGDRIRSQGMETHGSAGRGRPFWRPPAWVIVVGLLLVLAGTAPPLASRSYAWAAATAPNADFLIRLWLIGLALATFGVLVELLLRWVRVSGGRPPVRWRWWTKVGLLFLCMVFAGLSHIPLARMRIAGFVFDATSEVGRMFRHAGSARITGRATRMVLLHALAQTEVPEERESLRGLIDALPRAWVFAADAAQIDVIEVLAGAAHEPSSWRRRVSDFLLGRSDDAFSPEHCGQLLDRLCDDAGCERLTGGSRAETTHRLSGTIGWSVRDAVREAFVRGDDGPGAVPLAVLTGCVYAARLGGSMSEPVWQSEQAALASEQRSAMIFEQSAQDATGAYGSPVHQEWWKLTSQCDSALEAVHEKHDDFLAVAMAMAEASATEGVRPPILDASMTAAVERLAASSDPIDRALAAIAGVEPPLFGASWAAADAALDAAMAEEVGPAGRAGFDTFRLDIARGARALFGGDWGGARPFYDAAFLAWPIEPAGLLFVGEALRLPRSPDRAEGVLEARRLLKSRLEHGIPLRHAETATALNNLGLNLSESRNFAEAREALLEALKHDAEARDADDPALAVRYFNLACMSVYTGDYERAQQEIERAAAIEAHALPPGHWKRARTDLLAAVVLDFRGSHDAALERAVSAVAQYHAIFPPLHPAIGDADHALSRVYYNLGQMSEAADVAARSIENEEAQDFPEATRLGFRREILAMSLWVVQGAAAALPHMEQSIAEGSALAAAAPADFATRHFNHALLLQDLGRLDEALAAIDRCIAIEEAAFGPKALTLADSERIKAQLLRALERREEALAAAQRAVEVASEALGADHPSLSDRHALVTNILIDLEMWTEANVSVERSIAIDEAHPESSDANLGVHYFNHAITLARLGRYDESAEQMTKSIAHDEATLGANDPELIRSLEELASIESQRSHLSDAIPALERAIAIAEATDALRSVALIDDLQTLASYHEELGQTDAAIAALTRSIALCDADPELAEVEVEARDWIAWLLLNEGRLGEAITYLEASLERANDLLGPEHDLIDELTELLGEAQAAAEGQEDEQPTGAGENP